jgi:2-(1,2-epoxy-1,2-dihydrophenyl)acetyl-CoA isomerase
VIAAVNGPAAGGGLSLAMVADYRIASSNATFTAAYFRLGLPLDGGASAFLVTTIGAARTMELLLTNRTLAPDEALAWGLVNEVVPPEILLERACEVAGRFGGLPAETLLTTRRLLDTATSHTLSAQLDAEEAAMRAAAQRPEFKQALESFLSRQST